MQLDSATKQRIYLEYALRTAALRFKEEGYHEVKNKQLKSYWDAGYRLLERKNQHQLDSLLFIPIHLPIADIQAKLEQVYPGRKYKKYLVRPHQEPEIEIDGLGISLGAYLKNKTPSEINSIGNVTSIDVSDIEINSVRIHPEHTAVDCRFTIDVEQSHGNEGDIFKHYILASGEAILNKQLEVIEINNLIIDTTTIG